MDRDTILSTEDFEHAVDSLRVSAWENHPDDTEEAVAALMAHDEALRVSRQALLDALARLLSTEKAWRADNERWQGGVTTLNLMEAETLAAALVERETTRG